MSVSWKDKQSQVPGPSKGVLQLSARSVPVDFSSLVQELCQGPTPLGDGIRMGASMKNRVYLLASLKPTYRGVPQNKTHEKHNRTSIGPAGGSARGEHAHSSNVHFRKVALGKGGHSRSHVEGHNEYRMLT